MTMGWCLDCHRNPAPNLREPEPGVRDRMDSSARPEAGGAETDAPLRDRHDASHGLFCVSPVIGRPPIRARRAFAPACPATDLQAAPPRSRRDARSRIRTVVARGAGKNLPYVHMPEGLLPGVPQHYATALPLAGYGRGVVVTAFEGRPTKVEGNPRHPASLGATDVFAQAEMLSLYDPDRSQTDPRSRGEISDWTAFESAFRARLRNTGRTKAAASGCSPGASLRQPCSTRSPKLQKSAARPALARLRADGGRRRRSGARGLWKSAAAPAAAWATPIR